MVLCTHTEINLLIFNIVLSCSSEDTPPQAPVTTESQVSNRSFMLQRPDAQSEATRESEDTQQNIFRRSVSAKDSPRKRVIEEDR